MLSSFCTHGIVWHVQHCKLPESLSIRFGHPTSPCQRPMFNFFIRMNMFDWQMCHSANALMQLLKDRGHQWCGRRLRRRLPGGVGEEAFLAGVLPGAMGNDWWLVRDWAFCLELCYRWNQVSSIWLGDARWRLYGAHLAHLCNSIGMNAMELPI